MQHPIEETSIAHMTDECAKKIQAANLPNIVIELLNLLLTGDEDGFKRIHKANKHNINLNDFCNWTTLFYLLNRRMHAGEKQLKSLLDYVYQNIVCVFYLKRNKLDITKKSDSHWRILCGQGISANSPKSSLMRTDSQNNNCLHLAIQCGDEAAVSHYLSFRPRLPINNFDERGHCPLIAAVRMANSAMVRALLQAGAVFKVSDAAQRTALHFSILHGLKDIFKVLLQGAFDQNYSLETILALKDKDEQTLLDYINAYTGRTGDKELANYVTQLQTQKQPMKENIPQKRSALTNYYEVCFSRSHAPEPEGSARKKPKTLGQGEQKPAPAPAESANFMLFNTLHHHLPYPIPLPVLPTRFSITGSFAHPLAKEEDIIAATTLLSLTAR